MEFLTGNNFTSMVARRLSATVGGRRSKTAVRVAVCGISLALFTVFVTFSIVAGFKTELENKIYAFNSVISIYPVDSDYIFEEDKLELETIINSQFDNPNIYSSRLKAALIKSETNFDNVVLLCNDDSIKNHFFSKAIIDGYLNNPDEINEMTISKSTAQRLNVGIGDRLDVVIPIGDGYKLRKLTVAGLYDTHFADYDKNIAFASASLLKSLQAGTNDSWGEKLSVDYNFNNLEDVGKEAATLQQNVNTAFYNGALHGRYAVGTITQNAGSYFAWLSLLDTNVVVITLLMIFISTFTLISSIIIIILERVPLIGLLRAQGALKSQIKTIFIRFGSRVLIKAIIIANILAIGLILLQNKTHFLPLNPEDYYLTYVPMQMNWLTIVITDICAMILGIVCMLLPSMMVNKISLTKAIRFN